MGGKNSKSSSVPVQFQGISFKGKKIPKQDSSVAIIGAGPSGLHMAHLLKKNGINNITIFEQSDRFGGKTYSYPHSSDPAVIHELGTCYMHPCYYSAREFLEELDTPELKVSEERTPVGYRVFDDLDPSTKDLPDSELKYMDFDAWVLATVEKQVLPKALWWFPDGLMKVALGDNILRYSHIHKEIFGDVGKYSLPPLPSPKQLPRINKSFLEFLDEHKLSALKPVLAYAMTAQGYGTLSTIPTYYGMMWITPQLLKEYMNPNRKYPTKTMLKNGWSKVWEVTIKKHNLKIRYNTDIKSIVRKENEVIIEGKESGNDFSEKFDFLIVACPPASLPVDYSEEEKNIWSKLQHFIFRTNLYEREPDPRYTQHQDIWPEFLFEEATTGKGMVYAMRDSVRALYGLTHHDQEKPREQVCYQMYDDPSHYTEDDAQKKLQEHFESSEIKNPRIIKQNTTKYFYHFDLQTISQGIHSKILDLQGRNRTFYVHASCSMESILDITSYNNLLVDTLFSNVKEKEKENKK